jgi:predicted ATP-grasp superfamily ATP-dependent carboligase
VDENSGGLVLLIGSGQRDYREYLIKGLAARAALWLVDERAPTWQRPYIVGSSVVELLDHTRIIPDQQGLIDAAADIARSRTVLGVCTYDELLVIAAAHVTERLGVRGLSVDGAYRCRNKHSSRLTLTSAGLPQPRYELVYTRDEAVAAAQRIGYPVVLKPRGMGGSVGVVLVEEPGKLAAAFAVCTRASLAGPPTFEDGILIEELVDGPEISIDGAVVAGQYQPFCLARKRLGAPPYFEEVGHVVDAGDPLLDDADLRHVLAEAHRALGVPYGITHTEVRLSARGPVIIEVNARLGGDLIPYLGKFATGIDPGHVAADVAVGIRPRLKPSLRACAGIRFLYPPEDCRVLDISLPEPGAVPGLVLAKAMAAPGAAIRLPPRAHVGRYAFLVATANHSTACDARLDEAAALVGLQYEPLKPSELTGERPW